MMNMISVRLEHRHPLKPLKTLHVRYLKEAQIRQQLKTKVIVHG